jgi:flagellar biosynthesis chaperone FliJ
MISKRGMKRKEIIGGLNESGKAISYLMQRLQSMEIVFEQYVEMQKNGKKFEKFLDKKTEELKKSQEKTIGESK